MDLYKEYNLTPIINACGKLTRTSNARVYPQIKDVVLESLDYFFDADELTQAASNKIAEFTGTQAGFVTACTAAGLTLCAAACMTGTDMGKVAALPDTSKMKNEVIVQKGHTVDFGAPVTQMIRLSGAKIIEAGNANGTSYEMLEAGFSEKTAAVLFVISHHTIRYGCVSLRETVKLAHLKGVPVIVDAAAQCFNLKMIAQSGADLIVCSGHKYLSSTVSGLVCGKKDLVDAAKLQNKGIGRAMKVGKEGVFGLLAAIDYRMNLDLDEYYTQIRNCCEKVRTGLSGIKGVRTEITPDPNGNPFCRARVFISPDDTGTDAASICRTSAGSNPSVRLRDHHVDEGYFDVDVVELTDYELDYVINRLKEIIETREGVGEGKTGADPLFAWYE